MVFLDNLGELTPILYILFQKVEEEGALPNAVCEVSIIVVPKERQYKKIKFHTSLLYQYIH